MTIRDWFQFARENVRKEKGQTMAEYGVTLGVITVATVGAFALLGTKVKAVLDAVMTRF
jgi:Flp pilus assembly pilin Flp